MEATLKKMTMESGIIYILNFLISDHNTSDFSWSFYAVLSLEKSSLKWNVFQAPNSLASPLKKAAKKQFIISLKNFSAINIYHSPAIMLCVFSLPIIGVKK